MQYGDYTDDYRRSTRRSQQEYRMDRQQRLMVTIGVGAAVMLLIGVGVGFALGRATAPKPAPQVVVQPPTETVAAVVPTPTPVPTATTEPTTPAPAPTGPDTTPPPTPKQLGPPNNARIDASRVDLRWSAVKDASGKPVKYAFQIQNLLSDGSWSTGQTITGLKTTFYSARVLQVTRRWRVWAIDAAGNASPKSGWRKYKHTYVAPKPTTPKRSTTTT